MNVKNSLRKPLAMVGNQSNLSKLPQPKLKVNDGLKTSSLKSSSMKMKPPSSTCPISAKRARLDNTISNKATPARKNVVSSARKPAQTLPLKRSTSMLSVAGKTQVSAPQTGKNGSKRPAWDIKGRLQDMETKFQEKMEENNYRISILETKKLEVETDLLKESSEKEIVSETASKLEERLKSIEESYNRLKMDYNREVEEVKFTNETLENRLKSVRGDLDASLSESAGLKNTVAKLTSSRAGLQAEFDSNKILMDKYDAECRMKGEKIIELEDIINKQKEGINTMEQKMRENEGTRRKLHNMVQELKGNIRVFCRVRPFLPSEISSNSPAPEISSFMSFPDPDHHSLSLSKHSNDCNLNESCVNGRSKSAAKYDFNFDRVFEPGRTQAEVFEEISQLVQSALDGYDVCVFAYGQTGSGKTYTMEGPENIHDPENYGMIPKAVEQIFLSCKELESKGWKYTVQVSYLEIYNETIRDLLGSNDQNSKHEIKMKKCKSSEIYITNLAVEAVENSEQVYKLIKKARKNRAVAATKCNHRSSRSHSVFQLKITGINSITTESCEGRLNLVDLAGSERLKESGSAGQRLEETKNINSSLSVLGSVIMSLAKKADHIPYRNSKLTHVLMNSLGGNSKTLMFVNISPREENLNESLNSLRFATQVNQCQIGTAQKKVK